MFQKNHWNRFPEKNRTTNAVKKCKKPNKNYSKTSPDDIFISVSFLDGKILARKSYIRCSFWLFKHSSIACLYFNRYSSLVAVIFSLNNILELILNFSLRLGISITSWILLIKQFLLFTGQMKPLSPSEIISLDIPTSEETTGQPQASASIIVSPYPSYKEVDRKTLV